MKNVYVVFFCTGEYEDRSEVMMMAFRKKAKAEKYSAEVNKLLVSFNLHSDQSVSSAVRFDQKEAFWENKSKNPEWYEYYVDSSTGASAVVSRPIPVVFEK